eukprot:721804_1
MGSCFVQYVYDVAAYSGSIARRITVHLWTILMSCIYDHCRSLDHNLGHIFAMLLRPLWVVNVVVDAIDCIIHRMEVSSCILFFLYGSLRGSSEPLRGRKSTVSSPYFYCY